MFARSALAFHRTVGRNPREQVSISANSVTFQFVRWRRQRTDPKAKNKVIIKRRPVPNEWEDDFLKKRNNHYKTLMKGIRNIFTADISAAAAMNELSIAHQRELDSLPGIMEWNEQENQKTKALREVRLVEMAKSAEADRLVRLPLEVEEKVKNVQYIEELVRKEKEASKDYITMENMEEKIIEAIGTPKDYNFRVTQDGSIVLPQDTAWKDLKEKLESEKQTVAESAS